jgi:Resolvase, N terminal domain
LARSTTELLTIEADLSKRGVGLVVLSMGGEERLDTRNPTNKLMLTILAGVATWEQETMLERQREGIAKAEDKYKGRKPTVANLQTRSGQPSQPARSPRILPSGLGWLAAASIGCWRARRTDPPGRLTALGCSQNDSLPSELRRRHGL